MKPSWAVQSRCSEQLLLVVDIGNLQIIWASAYGLSRLGIFLSLLNNGGMEYFCAPLKRSCNPSEVGHTVLLLHIYILVYLCQQELMTSVGCHGRWVTSLCDKSDCLPSFVRLLLLVSLVDVCLLSYWHVSGSVAVSYMCQDKWGCYWIPALSFQILSAQSL